MDVQTADARVQELTALLRQVRHARAEVPTLARPLRAIGQRGTWTGAAADRLRHDHLDPLDRRLRSGFDRLEAELQEDLQHAVRTATAARDAEASAATEAATEAARRAAAP
ncbi:hypothetical protein [Kineococcus sp. SYSU DK001]|uniref:hypothetical protein n=1 Tax=Kineococcus sp. SYSU DK001 TaxID=3383122 RepID=UPI003D7DBE30